MPVDLPKRVFNVDEYYRMAEVGIFQHERVELVEGEIVAMGPMGTPHSACISRLTQELSRLIERRFILRVQLPLRLNERTELEPDISIVRYRSDHFASRQPRPEDALLALEVAESSLPYDQDVKMPLYARAGVPEAWLVDLSTRTVTVHSDPSSEGYQRLISYGPAETAASSSLSWLTLGVEELLP